MVSLGPPFQTILLRKHLNLFCIRPLAMMLFLIGNVARHALDIGVRHRECSVAAAPRKSSFDELIVIDPVR